MLNILDNMIVKPAYNNYTFGIFFKVLILPDAVIDDKNVTINLIKLLKKLDCLKY